MAQPYLTDLQALLERLDLGDDRFECKHFFSGAAAYVEGVIFMTWTPSGLALKLPQDACDRLLREGGTPLRYFPKAPVKKGYVVLGSELVEDDDALKERVSDSIAFVTKST